ncbi:glycoside hydrolase family 18 [Brevibacillus laterosporus]|uniref:Putative sporulation-specific glycosylase YdhD n=1 Tax=Brevibacillus laterosporus LMG 15441 TaxID=1042163 RepID=A0A075R097_BRELA|nr:glycosyl hydrolase family 18 protein [Brevibacillus laterosporus]AIG24861.1 putative sporulation-specific glycosylase YdhD [Brevibacillus laterosporus LMG 15441]RJL11135.1 glycoside hydrolase family 18 [Brevibacillus laterosporus]TPH16170.1 glycoside hydrolase family 18 [Brevibacillus laterosporus]HAS00883.1 glycoside hydrolase family 18 [Brevibacillus sp.]
MPRLFSRFFILLLVISSLLVASCQSGSPSQNKSATSARNTSPHFASVHETPTIQNVISSARPREVLGFYTEAEEPYPGSLPTLSAQHEQLSTIVPFWHKLDDKNPGYLQTTLPKEEQQKIIDRAHANQVQVYLLVHNLFYGSIQKGKDVARDILRNPKNQRYFLRNLEREVLSMGYDGINLDIENLYLEDKFAFTQLVKNVTELMHRYGKTVTVCVPANTGDERSNVWSPWFDYKLLGRYADRLVIMAYDEHNPRTKPGPVASIQWAEDTVRYALSQGVPAQKILLGVAGYGWNWNSSGEKAEYQSYKSLMEQSKTHGATLNWDQERLSPHMQYMDEAGNMHIVWFENSFSTRSKLDLIEKYDLAGIALWRLGLEDPTIWDNLSNQINVWKTDMIH